jgi:hypothetical protein
MSLSDLASIGSFVSGVAVLISLVYLALQVRQAERNQRAILQQGRAARASDLTLRMATDDLSRVFAKVSFETDDISPQQLVQWLLIFRANMLGFEDTFFQHKHKVLDDDAYDSTVASFHLYLTLPVWRASWRRTRSQYDRSFAAFVDRLVDDIAVGPPSDMLALWKSAVAAETAEPVSSVPLAGAK